MAKERKFTIDWPHGHRTVGDHQRVRIIGSVKSTEFPIVTCDVGHNGEEALVRRYQLDGSYAKNYEHSRDLEDVPAPKRRVWVNSYPGYPYLGAIAYNNREQADSAAAGMVHTVLSFEEINDEDPSA